MTSAKDHLARMERIRRVQSTQHLQPLAQQAVLDKHLTGEVDESLLASCDVSEAYSKQIHEFDLRVSPNDVQHLLETIDVENGIETILEPVFLSLFDGTMRAFKIGTKQGITASRLYHECQTFRYDSPANSRILDSYTEVLNERQNIETLGKNTTYKDGDMTRDGETTNMRDGAKMKAAKEEHFGGDMRAEDGYGGEPIYSNKRHAKSEGQHKQSAEADHAVSCSEICHKLKSNKALNPEDIKEIVNTDENLVITSMKHNRGPNVGKFDKTKEELQKEIDQGYVENTKGKKHPLSDEEIAARKRMVEKMEASQKVLDSQTNKKVLENVLHDRKVQKRFATDAINAAGNQSIGDLVMFMIKPLYFELRDCITNGIEKGVGAESFKTALTIRFTRMKQHILQQATVLLKDGLFNFFKNFLSMLFEGIVNCFVGIFKNIARMMKEGFKILLQIAPVLKDKTTSPAQKGDAILKLIVGSLSVFASIGIESWLNSLGLGEPWSIIVSSVISAVVTTLTMYLLDKIDLFGVNKVLKAQRIEEVLSLSIENSKVEMFTSVAILI
ncbi:hypothetical protein [Citrobacter sp. RHB25-C09]|uniref:hypothetical protein n=1 Tax=Citrobacter sp. RHB25-C09 TaxID=2742624 RepID=UPI0020173841|nr:hypothetical protein [Citrobacter sp. RHB25-C09]